MQAPTRKLVIGAAAAAVAAAAWFAPSAQEELAAPRAARGADTPRPAASFFSALPQRAGIGAPAGELFRARVPPAPKVAAAQAAAPVAPPNPYRFVGKVVQNGTARIFLAKGDRVHEAKPGEELEEGFRVESISDEQVVLVYVPLGTRAPVSIETSGLGADAVAEESPAAPRGKRWRQRTAAAPTELQ